MRVSENKNTYWWPNIYSFSAVGLRRAGIDVTLFEAAVGDTFFLSVIYHAQYISSQSKFGEVGAGVSLGSQRLNSNTLMLTFTHI